MKKILKSSEPSFLKKYKQNNPDASWDKFKGDGNNYSQLSQICWSDQGGLCGYCEKKPKNGLDQQIEHFHQKSDSLSYNWALVWENVFAVCNGGQNKFLAQNPLNYCEPLPENLSCDAFKNHKVMKGHLPSSSEGYILNPLQIVHTPTLFKFDPISGFLLANNSVCQTMTIIPNHIGSTLDIVNNTIVMLNLNCDRLSQVRLKVWHELESRKTQLRQQNIRPKIGLGEYSKKIFSQNWPSFFTTWRIILSSHAENYLQSINYQG